MRTEILTAAALLGFAANSLLCRMALQPRLVDAATFTTVRLLSGAAMLLVLDRGLGRGGPRTPSGGSWASAAALFAYAAAFSFAYVRIGAGVGALLLFAAVQVTMLAGAVRRGERLGMAQWTGVAAALAGIVLLVKPGLSAPDIGGAVLMATAGVAWGVYSLRGRGSPRPLSATASNFLRAVPMTLALSLLAGIPASLDPRGAGLAVASGAVASGVGYTFWYGALRALSASRAAVLQLSVPLLAAAGGIVLLGEPLSARLAVSAAAIVGGIALAVSAPPRRSQPCGPIDAPLEGR